MPHTHPARPINYLCICLVAISLLVALPLKAQQTYWQGVAVEVISDLNDAQSEYLDGDVAAAQSSLISSYFGHFEGQKMEAAMRMELGAKHTYSVERMFGQLRKQLKLEDNVLAIKVLVASMAGALTADAILLDDAGITAEVFRVNQ